MTKQLRLSKRDRRIVFWLVVLMPAFTALAKILLAEMTWQSALAFLLLEVPVAFVGAKLNPPGVDVAPARDATPLPPAPESL